MDKVKEFLSKKSVGFYFVAGALLCSIVGFILYLVNGDQTKATNAFCIICFIVCILSLGVTLWKDFWGIGRWLPVLMAGFIVGNVIYERTDYIAYSLTGQNLAGAGDGPFSIFVAMLVFVVLTLIVGIVANALEVEKQ